MWTDLRYAWRALRGSPVFTAAAVLTLALGIGANTAIFSLVDQVLLQGLPVKHPDRLVLLHSEGPRPGWSTSDTSVTVFSYPMYRDLRDRGTALDGLAARTSAPVHVAWQDRTERASAEIVSGNFFAVLGVQAALGRALTPEDDRVAGGHPVVVLGHVYWRTRFGAAAAVLNQTILVNGHPLTVIGVAPPRFYGVVSGQTPDLYVPIAMKRVVTPTWEGLENRRIMWLSLIGRLRPGQSAKGTESALQTVFRPILVDELAQMNRPPGGPFRDRFLGTRLELRPAAQGIHQLRRQWEKPLVALTAMVGLVLLIACANVTNLLLARAAGREREIAVRLALGAGRGAIARQLLVESLALGVAGGVAGLLVAVWSTGALLRLLPEGATGGQLSGGLDLRLLGFSLGLALVSAVLFGVAPAAAAARADVAPALKDQAATTAGGGRQARFRKALVVAQVGLSVALVAGAGLFLRSLDNLLRSDPGFRPERLLTFSAEPRLNGYTAPRRVAFAAELQERLAGLPGVTAAGAAALGPFTNANWGSSVTVEGYRAREDEDVHCARNAVGPAYFRTMGIPLLAGREFTAADGATAPKVAIVNETFGRHFCGDRNPVGLKLAFSSGNAVKLDHEIVGVVRDSKHGSLRERADRFVYIPYAQQEDPGRISFYVRTAGDERTLEVRRVVREMDANLPVFDVKSMQAQVEESIYTDRLIAVLAAAFGVLATLLAAVGLYGVIAYAITRRTREIGIRVALGATRARVVGLVLREVAGFAGVGIALGVAAAVAGGRWVESQLFGLRGADPFVLAGAALALGAVALTAGYLPARRAARLDPMTALRHE